MPWYPSFPADWLSLTRGWPLSARGVLRELLDAQWDLGTLPEAPAQLRELARATRAEWGKAWPLVEPHVPLVDGGRQNPQLATLRMESIARYERQRAGADHTNRRRAHSHRDADRVAPRDGNCDADRVAYRDGQRVEQRSGDPADERAAPLNAQRDAIRARVRGTEVVHREEQVGSVLADSDGVRR